MRKIVAQQVLSFPFELDPNKPGAFKKVEQESDSYKAQQIEAYIRTEKTERPIFADFGIEDPTFMVLSDDLQEAVDYMSDFSFFYTNIILDDIVTQIGEDGSLSIDISYF